MACRNLSGAAVSDFAQNFEGKIEYRLQQSVSTVSNVGLSGLLTGCFKAKLSCQQIECPAMDTMEYPKTQSISSDGTLSARVHTAEGEPMD